MNISGKCKIHILDLEINLNNEVKNINKNNFFSFKNNNIFRKIKNHRISELIMGVDRRGGGGVGVEGGFNEGPFL